MKICQLCTVDFTMYHFLLPLMAGLTAAGHEVVGVCADGEFVEQIRARGLRVETLPLARSLNPFRQLGAIVSLRRLFRQERFDLIQFHTPIGAMTGRIAAISSGMPRLVYTAHGFYFHDRTALHKRAVFVALEWLLGRFTHTLFTVSDEDAVTARRLGLCRDILAIGGGGNPEIFHPGETDEERAGLRAELGSADDTVVIMMVGRLVAEKGYPELLAAMTHVDAELWVVGERLASDHAGSVADDVARVEADADLAGRIRFLGYRSDIASLLRAADIFVLPSHREGMPQSIIEAMLTALPVVATDIRGSREEVVDGETGILIPVADQDAIATALNRLCAAPELRRSYGAAGLARARTLFVEDAVVRRQLDHLGLASP